MCDREWVCLIKHLGKNSGRGSEANISIKGKKRSWPQEACRHKKQKGQMPWDREKHSKVAGWKRSK